MSRRSYPKYKPSGVEWLGRVPEHWDVVPLSRLAATIQTGPFGSQLHEADYVPGGIPLINPAHIVDGRLAPDEESRIDEATAVRLDRHRLQVGDILMGRRGEIGRCALVGPQEQGWVCGTGCLVIRLAERPPEFLARVFGSRGFKDLLELNAVGTTMLNLNASIVGRALVPAIPRAEEQALARFLDFQAARLDVLIGKKQCLIGRLKEKRAALILQSTTRGLPPDASRAAGLQPRPKLRPSGIGWVGDVPAHWNAGCLRRYAQMRTGHTPSRTEPQYWDDCDIPWFTLADVWQLRDGRQIYLGETAERISRVGLANSAAELLPAGTVVFSRTASVGFSGIMPIPMATSQDFWNWVPGPELTSEYLLYLFRSMRQEFERLTMGSTHQTIYQPDAARLAVCVPPLQEQRAIVEYLNRETARIDMLTAKVEAAIERLQEYRAALITAAVTGQIDVRGQGTPGLPAAAGSG